MLYDKIHLESDETVLIEVRKHWFILAIHIVNVVLLALIPLILFVLFDRIVGERFDAATRGFSNTLWYFYIAWLLLMWMSLFNIWTNWYLDTWTLTNKRLIAVDQRGLFNRATGSFRLERLQDMNVEINGIVATLLNFGTLEAQTAAGSEDEFRATGLPSPRELKALILKAADDTMRSYRSSVSSDGV